MNFPRALLWLILCGTAPAADPALCPGAWTLVHIPDTQNYVSDSQRTAILNRQMEWIAARRAERNIRFAVHVGDLVNDNGATQWGRARAALDILTDEVPYALCTGNHDCGPGGSGNTRETKFILQTAFGAGSPYPLQTTFRDSFAHPGDPPGNTQNAWHTFRAGDQDFLVLTCEWGPRDKVISWMESMVAGHPWHRVILVCHAYLASGSARYDWSQDHSGMNPRAFALTRDPDGVNDGQNIWDKLVKKYGNICLVCCGHADQGFRTVTGVHGNKVHEMLYNTQFFPNGGNGWLRLLEFLPDGQTVQARTFSTHLDEWDESAGNAFRFTLSPVSTVDSDADGMPDYFELRHGWDPQSPSNAAADPDHDGHSNLQEFTACTSPVDPGSRLRVKSVSMDGPDRITVQWQSIPGMRYQVQRSTSTNGSSWNSTGEPISASDFVTAATVSSTASRQFFRILAVPHSP